MYRTVEFDPAWSDEPEFDDNGVLIVPGAREMTQSIVDGLRRTVNTVSDIDQHENYGWGFYSSTNDASFYNVVCPVDKECYLTVQMDWYFIRSLLLQNPKASFERYCAMVTRVLEGLPGVSKIAWEDFRS